METTIRLKPAELNSQMLDMVKLLVERTGFKEIASACLIITLQKG